MILLSLFCQLNDKCKYGHYGFYYYFKKIKNLFKISSLMERFLGFFIEFRFEDLIMNKNSFNSSWQE